jgi:hypothetical protein
MTEVPLAGFEHALHVLPNGSYILFKGEQTPATPQ